MRPVLVALLEQIAVGADPFAFIDMHAASGFYDLTSDELLRCQMFGTALHSASCGI